MREASIAIEKLRRIRKLWQKVRGTRVNTPKYRKAIAQIGVLSKEYQKLVNAVRKPKKSK
jgi:hypothetical protein